MRKLISLLLALTMVFSLAIAVSAYDDASTATMTKTYTANSETAVSPEEEITFTVEKGTEIIDAGVGAAYPETNVSVEAVKLGQGDATVKGTGHDIEITLPEYTAVGIYTYTITEVGSDLAGVTYYTTPMTLYVTVIQDYNENDEPTGKVRIAAVHCEADATYGGDGKTDDFANAYNAGTLTVSKTVEGMLADTSKKFDMTVTFTSEKEVGAPIYVNDEALDLAWTDGVATYDFALAHGENITFTNIPYGVSYSVEEDDYSADDYEEPEYTGKTGTINATNEDAETSIVNTKTGTPDTGISLDSVPFVLMLVICAGAVVLFVTKRRSVEF